MTKPPYAEVRAGEEVIRFHMVMKGGILSLKAVTRAGMSGISIPPAVSGGLQENQGTRTDLTSVRNLTEADTKKELAKIAAKAKEKQREHGGTAPGRTLCQISDEVIDTKKELAKIAGVSVRFEGATYRGPCRSPAITLIRRQIKAIPAMSRRK